MIAINGCKFRGSLKPIDCEDILGNEELEAANVEASLPLGKFVKGKVIKFQKEPKIKIKIGTLQKYFNDFEGGEQADLLKKDD